MQPFSFSFSGIVQIHQIILFFAPGFGVVFKFSIEDADQLELSINSPDRQLLVAGRLVALAGKDGVRQLGEDDLRRGVHKAAGAQMSAEHTQVTVGKARVQVAAVLADRAHERDDLHILRAALHIDAARVAQLPAADAADGGEHDARGDMMRVGIALDAFIQIFAAMQAKAMVHGTSPLHHLKEVEFEVVRLRHIPEDRMVGGLLTGLDLAQLHARVQCGGAQHFFKQLARHEVAARGGGEVAAARQQPQGAEVDVLIAALGAFHRFARLGEGRRVEDDKVIRLAALFLQLGEKVEHVRGQEVHAALQPIAHGVRAGHVDGALRDVHGGDVLRAAPRGIERKGAGMGKAVEDSGIPAQLLNCQTIVFLIKERSGLRPFSKLLWFHSLR